MLDQRPPDSLGQRPGQQRVDRPLGFLLEHAATRASGGPHRSKRQPIEPHGSSLLIRGAGGVIR